MPGILDWLDNQFGGAAAAQAAGGILSPSGPQPPSPVQFQQAPVPSPLSSRIGLFGATLKDVGADLGGRPGEANNISSYQEQMRQLAQQQNIRNAMAMAASNDPGTRQKGYAQMTAMGMDPSMFQKASASSAMPSLLDNLRPQENPAPVTVTPQITAPGQVAQREASGVYSPTPTFSQPSLSDALSATGSPELSAQLAPDIIKEQMARQDKSATTLTPQEAVAAGFRPDSVVQKDAYGNLKVLQASDVKSADAAAQQIQLERENPTLAVSQQQLAETKRHNQVEESNNNPLGQNYKPPVGSDGKPLTGPAYLATLSPAMAGTVKAIGDGRMAPLSGYALSKPGGMAVMGAVTQYNPNYDATTMPTRTAARKAFTSGKNGNTVRSLNVGISHLDTLSHLAGALDNGNIQAINALGQVVSQQTGNPAPTNFDAAKQIVGDEVVKAIVGTGGSQQDRAKAADAISKANSPAQLAGVINTYQTLLGGQLRGLQQQYQKSTGLQDFGDFLSPEVQQKLGTLPASGAPPPTQPLPTPQSLPRVSAPGKINIIKYDAQGNRIQ